MLRIENLDPKALGQRLTEARKARGVTQEDAAKHIGCSRPTFIAVEKGNRLPKAEEIVEFIEGKCGADVFVWFSSCYGACDLPCGLEHLKIDLVIQFGHNKFVKGEKW